MPSLCSFLKSTLFRYNPSCYLVWVYIGLLMGFFSLQYELSVSRVARLLLYVFRRKPCSYWLRGPSYSYEVLIPVGSSGVILGKRGATRWEVDFLLCS